MSDSSDTEYDPFEIVPPWWPKMGLENDHLNVPENPAEVLPMAANPQDPAASPDDESDHVPTNSAEPIGKLNAPGSEMTEQERVNQWQLSTEYHWYANGNGSQESDDDNDEAEEGDLNEPREICRLLDSRPVSESEPHDSAGRQLQAKTLTRTQKRRRRAQKGPTNRKVQNDKAKVRKEKRKQRDFLRMCGWDDPNFPPDVQPGHVSHQPRKAQAQPAQPKPGVGGTKRPTPKTIPPPPAWCIRYQMPIPPWHIKS